MNLKRFSAIRMPGGILFAVIVTAGFLGALTITVKTPPTANIWYWENGRTYMINWTTDTPLSGQVRIELRDANAAAQVRMITAQHPNAGHFRWTVPVDLPLAQYRVRVTSLAGGEFGDSEKFHVIPWIEFTYPHFNGLEWMRGKTYTFTWKWVGPQPNSLQLRTNNGNIATDTTLVESVPNTGAVAWKVPADFPLGGTNPYFRAVFPSINFATGGYTVKIIPALPMLIDPSKK
jgi:hypothetical protein